jgi:hypothetical protein
MSLQEKLGCTHDYLLWKESWLNLQMKIADLPRISRDDKKIAETAEEIVEFLDKHI